MPTERGWAVVGTGLALGALWYMFGELELGIAALLFLTASAGAVLMVAGRRPVLDVTRHTTPNGVHEGDHATVQIRVVNRGPRLGQVSMTDDVLGLGTAEFATAGVANLEHLTATYRILCRPRGVYQVGPVSVRVSDPLGLAATREAAGSVDTLVVYPAVEDLDGFPRTPGRNLTVNASRPEHSQRGGEDFYTLREYQRGDDLRRVHWPSSARRDRLMIRQLETPWQARSLVWLDNRQSAYRDEADFERAVSGAACVVRHLARGGFSVDVWTGEGRVTGITRPGGYPAIMERLAVAAPRPRIELGGVVATLQNSGGGGVLVIVTGEPDEEIAGLARLLGADYPSVILLTANSSPEVSSARFQKAGMTVVESRPGQLWGPAWSAAMGNTWQSASVGS